MTKPCKMCSKPIKEDDWDLCEECIDKGKTFDNAYDIGNYWRENVNINGFLKHCFSQIEIDEILWAKFKSLPENEQKKLIDEYCEDDTYYFVRYLIEKWKQEN